MPSSTPSTATQWRPSAADTEHVNSIRAALNLGADVPAPVIISYALEAAIGFLRVSPRPLEACHSPSDASAAQPVIAPSAAPWADPAGPAEVPEPPADRPGFDPAQPITAYTDGACSGNPGPGAWGFVLGQGGRVLAEGNGPSTGPTTNNRMEVTAVLEALRAAPEGATVEVITDSRNVIGWLSGGWKRNDPAIAALCKEVDGLMALRTVTFRWVKGHAGDPLNERVDRLAVRAIKG